VEIPEKTAPVENTDQGESQPKKVFKKPIGGVMMQGFDPAMLANQALKRREQKNWMMEPWKQHQEQG